MIGRGSAQSELSGQTVKQWALCVLALAVPTAVALAIQLSTYPNHDVAWVLWGTREMLQGAQYGRDIIEPNPPLAWYLSMPTTILAMALGVPLDWTFRIALALAGAVSAASLVWLRPLRMTFAQSIMLAVVAAIALVTLQGREFGQRDPVMMIAVLPYLALSARRFDGEPVPGLFARIAIGAIAGLGFALKPYFLVVPLLIEAILWVWGKKPQALFRSENVSAAVVILAYAGWLLAFEQPYLYEIIPLVRGIYWSFDHSTAFIFKQLWPLLVGVIPFAFLTFQRKDGLGIVLLAAFCGFVFSYLMQHKGYHYHLLPARTVSLLLVAGVALDESLAQRLRLAALALAAALCALWMVQFIWWWPRARPGGPLYSQIERINQSIARHAGGGHYLVITIRTYPNFPAGIYAPSRYASRTNAQWFVPAVSQLRANGLPAESIERHAREFILHDLRHKPGLVMVDTDSEGHTRGPRNFDILKFYEEDPAFRAEWRHYREIERINSFRQFVRSN